ncbi:hypothetical protein U0026_16820 [Kluyvera intermedia]|jgi:hypothetical protein|uniref:hypothetical protein n=1 Tax=Kluyvera intermedia TaxID=61648 RepID=UPI0007884D39|nr:hypothetical protein [Kluyvera intermedia]WQD28676.1 hypothetical protein U0026_16820 [Kluyvera intermedia]VDZ84361.1 Uncharacterised protein [Kluyvera intermedia]
MSEVKVEYLVKELSARVDELETKNNALKAVLMATIAHLPAEVTQQARAVLKESYELSVNGAPDSLVDSFDKRQKEIESVVGSLK